MAKILDDDYMVCSDCLQAIANDDFTGLDYHYGPEEAEERQQQITNGIVHAAGYIVPGDSDKDDDFSNRICDCCNSDLAGTRHHCVVMA